MPVSAVVFDWYATLAAPNPDDFWVRLPELITEAGGRPDTGALRAWEQDHPADHRERSASEAAYRAWQRHRLDDVFARSGLDLPTRTRLLDHIDEVRYSRIFTVFPDVPAAIADLKRQGIIVGICSNWDWDLDRHLAHNGIADLLDFVVCSAQVGYRKPHPAIFDLVLDRAGAAAHETLFVGDNWHDDVVGAGAAGITPVHIVRSGACAVDDHADVACTSELVDLARHGLLSRTSS